MIWGIIVAIAGAWFATALLLAIVIGRAVHIADTRPDADTLMSPVAELNGEPAGTAPVRHLSLVPRAS